VYFKQILDERCGCASYLIASRESHEAAIVDPSIQIGQYDDLLKERGFTLRYVIDTHVHADHISGGPQNWQMPRTCSTPVPEPGFISSPSAKVTTWISARCRSESYTRPATRLNTSLCW